MIKLLKLFHNNLPIRATKTGGFFSGSETEQFFKIASLPYFLAQVEKVPPTFSIVSPPAQVKQSGRLFEVADIGNLVSSLVGNLWSYKSEQRYQSTTALCNYY